MGTTYDDVVGLEFEGLGFQTFIAEPLAVDKCTIVTLGILDVNLESKVILVQPSEKTK